MKNKVVCWCNMTDYIVEPEWLENKFQLKAGNLGILELTIENRFIVKWIQCLLSPSNLWTC